MSCIDFHLVSFSLSGLISDSLIKPGFRSDHSSPIITIECNNNTRGPGYWKLNCSVLREAEYVQQIKNTINVTLENNKITDALLLWDTMKCQIRGESIRYCSIKKKKRNDELKELQMKQEIQFAEMQINPNDNDKRNEYLETSAQIEHIIQEKTNGNVLRCKIRWYEEGEKCSQYFLNLEKRNYNAKCITRLITSEGSMANNDQDILEEEKKFYEKLYHASNEPVSDEKLDQFLGRSVNSVPRLNEDDKTLLDKEITEQELLGIIKSCPNGKTPGLDGIPIEFYKVFWVNIKEHFVKAVQKAYENGELSLTQKQGNITLLPKKDKDCLLLKNWRPISLLNTDYKIISKCIAVRIKGVLEKLIHKDQTGFIPNRYIGENINTIQGILDYTDHEEIESLLVAIDFEKAFDYLEWPFIFKVLERFNFGNYIIKWVKTLYKNPSSCIHNNGWRSDFFKLSRGVRQGCPLSPYLFILCAELLSIVVRNNDNIQGIKIEDKEVKISQYADDTTLSILANANSLKDAIQLFINFQSLSGLKINRDKTEVVRIGSLKTSDIVLWPEGNLKWSNGPVKVLGINFTPNKRDLLEVNYHPKHRKLKNLYNLWQQRQLSLKGRITIVKSLGISQLVYLMSNIPSPPSLLMKEIQALNFKFIWNQKQDRIKRVILCSDYKDGGLKMKDMEVLDKSVKMTWIKRLVAEDENTTWKLLVAEQFKPVRYTRNFIFECNLSDRDFCNMFKKSFYSDFWYQVILTWCQYNYKADINDVDLVKTQTLWYNSYIRVKNKPFFMKSWFDGGIKYVRDLLDENGSLLSYQHFSQKFGPDKSFLTYHSIIAALPSEWKRVIRLDTHSTNNIVTPTIEQLLTCEDLSRKVYWHFCKKSDIDLMCLIRKWNTELGSDLDVETFIKFFQLIPKATISFKLQSFQYKMLHRAHTTNIFAAHIGKWPSDKCTFCNAEKETLQHLFFDCTHVKYFWLGVLQWLQNRTQSNFDINKFDILFGHTNDLVNLCTIIGKLTIYVSKVKNRLPDVSYFYSEIMLVERTEKDIAVRNNKITMHYKKWYIPEPTS